MNWVSTTAAALGMIAASSNLASAKICSDDMAKCLVKSTTAPDQETLVKWIFSDIALHPAIQSMANISETERNLLSQSTAQLFQRLVTQDCRQETVAALKYEGTQTIEASFSVLGQVAMRGVMTNPQVNNGIGAISTYLDENKLKALFAEAGINPQPSQTNAPTK